jgi:hypothetical protein
MRFAPASRGEDDRRNSRAPGSRAGPSGHHVWHARIARRARPGTTSSTPGSRAAGRTASVSQLVGGGWCRQNNGRLGGRG